MPLTYFDKWKKLFGAVTVNHEKCAKKVSLRYIVMLRVRDCGESGWRTYLHILYIQQVFFFSIYFINENKLHDKKYRRMWTVDVDEDLALCIRKKVRGILCIFDNHWYIFFYFLNKFANEKKWTADK